MTSKPSVKVLSKRYELHRKLGTGGMADVFLGRDRVLGRTVAVKMLLPQFAEDPQFIARFRREAQSAAALNHPNVVGVYDTGSDNGTYYIVMEYVEGRTLREVIREEGPLLPERAGEIASETAAALAFAHSKGIVHRDVKPGNVMLAPPDSSVKVTDFGIARAMSGDSVTQTATVLGTAQYFSPEQAEGKPVDARSDVYSLGVVLYEMLTRQVPFTGSSPVAIAYKHVKEAPIQPSRLNADVPGALEAIVMKALAKNPANRYQSAQEMREDIERWLHGRPVRATPVMDDATSVVSPLADETVVVARRPSTQTGPTRPVSRTRVVDPELQARRRRGTGYALLALIGVAIIAVLVWAFSTRSAPLLEVPTVLGERVSRAQEILQTAGFGVRVLDPIASTEVEEGTVALQDPEPGESLARGETVEITPSGGPRVVAVPQVVGKTLEEAQRLITEAGLRVGRITRRADNEAPADQVIGQSPTRGFLQEGGVVNIIVSTGRPMTTVPNVIGLTEEEARAAIADRGLNVDVQYRPSFFDCQEAVGRVCEQSPGGGTEVREGTTVTITVAEEPTPSPTPTDEPTDTAEPIPEA